MPVRVRSRISRGRLPTPEPEWSIFAKAFRGFFDKRKAGENDIAWKVLDYVVSSANDLERKARATGAHVAVAPSALSNDEQEGIRAKIGDDFPRAEKLCLRLSSDTNIMNQVFAAEVVDRARQGMSDIGSQLALYLGGNKIRLDTDRALDSSGTILQNRGNAAGPEAIMTVTKAWADRDRTGA